MRKGGEVTGKQRCMKAGGDIRSKTKPKPKPKHLKQLNYFDKCIGMVKEINQGCKALF